MTGRGNAAIAHGGGPTAVLNASLAGVYDAWLRHRPGDSLFAARFGLQGILRNDFVDLASIPVSRMAASAQAPGSIIGSSRYKLSPEDYDAILRSFRGRDIRTFFYTGGNGSMETAMQLHSRATDLQVIGVPKTIDNDLAVTDHTPGYPSAARFFIHAARDMGLDCAALPSPISVLEVLGRNTGWVVAATALARCHPDDAPNLIYFPERRVSLDRIASDTERVYRRLGRVVIAICEGQLDENGTPFGADVDRPESAVHRLASNLGHTLAMALTRKLGIRARAERPGLVGRASAALVSTIDRAEAHACGVAAVAAALAGESGKMVTLQRGRECGLTGFENVARIERPMPDSFMASDSCDVTDAFRDYLSPLVGEIDCWPEML